MRFPGGAQSQGAGCWGRAAGERWLGSKATPSLLLCPQLAHLEPGGRRCPGCRAGKSWGSGRLPPSRWLPSPACFWSSLGRALGTSTPQAPCTRGDPTPTLGWAGQAGGRPRVGLAVAEAATFLSERYSAGKQDTSSACASSSRRALTGPQGRRGFQHRAYMGLTPCPDGLPLVPHLERVRSGDPGLRLWGQAQAWAGPGAWLLWPVCPPPTPHTEFPALHLARASRAAGQREPGAGSCSRPGSGSSRYRAQRAGLPHKSVCTSVPGHGQEDHTASCSGLYPCPPGALCPPPVQQAEWEMNAGFLFL